MNVIELVFADDLPYFRESFPAMLQPEQAIKVTGIARDGKELVEMVRQKQPGVVITDIQMPVLDGIEATKQIKETFPGIEVIGLTMFDEEPLVMGMIEAGASGYISKATTDSAELCRAVLSVSKGGGYFSTSTPLRLSRKIAASGSKYIKTGSREMFSENEIEVMKLICQQKSSKQIAPMLGLSLRSVESCRERIMEKTGSQNIAGIVIYAIKNGFFRI